jgi:hypothetical protein
MMPRVTGFLDFFQRLVEIYSINLAEISVSFSILVPRMSMFIAIFVTYFLVISRRIILVSGD